MHTPRLLCILGGVLAAVSIATESVSAANDTWTGSGADNSWTNALNWGVFAPSPGDFLSWGSGPTVSSNNFPAGTIFGNIAFNPGAASFTLIGNGILLTNLYDTASGLVKLPDTAYGSISNNSASAQFVNLPVELMNGYHYFTTANGNLNIGGAITRDTGAGITFYTSGSGKINLTGSGLVTNNFHNLLGGWAVLNETNWATLDANSNVIPFANYTFSDSITTGTNLNYNTRGTAPAVASGGAYINSLRITNLTAGTLGFANAGDVLRLGQNGGIMLANTVNGANWNIGASAGSGIITAGTNSNSELFLCEADPTSAASGQLTVNSVIADNGGGGKVTVVKNGGQNLVFGAANNTYSGGTYINQSRIAPTTVGAMGYGPIFVNNGGQLWARANITFTNELYLSGSGNGESQQFGAVRLNGNAGCILSGTIHVNVATPKISNSGTLSGKITGGAGMRFSSAHASGTSPTVISISNTGNNYAGDTIVWADGFNTFLRMGNSTVIPNGPGTGNLIMTNSGHNAYFDLNGFNETINGLISAPGTAANDFVTNNNINVVSTLTVGGNNATGTFGGNIGVGNGQVALTKIGAGTETLSGVNGYTGNTTVNGGTLVLNGSGSISVSANVYLNGGTFDISSLASSSTTVQPLFMTNAALAVVLNPSITNLTTTTLTTGGTNNLINIAGVTGLSGAAYPTNFTLIKYSTFSSNSFFSFGTLVSPTIQGYITNTGSAVVVVLTNGPKPLLWKGSDPINPTFWDIATTTNWQFNGLSAVPFNTADSVTFDDTASTFNVNVTTAVSPGAITVNNATHNYTVSGAGSITGLGGLTKQGGGSLMLQESGDSFSGGVNVTGGSAIFTANNSISGGITIASGATVQVGNNTGTGTLPSGSVVDNGSLLFDVGANLPVPGSISGSGTVTNEAAGILNLSGVNTFTGALTVQQGTLQMGGPGALGAPASGVLIASGATLDVNGFSAGSLGVSVGGQGVGNNGAIVNNGGAQMNALQQVTNTASTTFGGTGRWDIRSANISDPTQGSLLTGGSGYNLAKTGVNQVSLVGITVDPALANIDIQQGILSVESATTGLGNPSGTLTVESGATLQLNQLTSPLDKNFVLNGNGIADTVIGLSSTSPGQNTLQPSGTITLNGVGIFDTAGSAFLAVNGLVNGSGSYTKTGTGTNFLAGAIGYTGATLINNGMLILNGTKTSGAGLTIAATGILAGTGSTTESVTNNGGTIIAGDPVNSPTATLGTENLTFNGGKVANDVDSANDQVVVTNNLTLNGLVTIQLISQNSFSSVTSGQHITVIQYGGSLNGTLANLTLGPVPNGYSVSIVDPATTPGTVQVSIDHVPQPLTWQGLAPGALTIWSTGGATNWINNNGNTLTAFTNGDNVVFDDTGTNLVTLAGRVNPQSITMNNSANAYTFTGNGGITGNSMITVLGPLTIANSGTNDFSGGITVYGGYLQIGNGGTNGSPGTGAITNFSALAFDLTNSVTVGNQIVGSGILTNDAGVVTLSGNNSGFTGQMIVNGGTLRSGSTSAFGAINSANIFVAGGATLDINGQNLGTQSVSASGAGVGGNGAIINTGGTQQNAIQNVALNGDTTFGGTGRWDLRSTNILGANLSTGGNPYNLTKTGTNSIWLVNVNFDPAISNITVQAGLLGYQESTSGLGDPGRTLSVAPGASLGFFNSTTPLNKIISLSGDGTNSAVAVNAGTNSISGPVSLTGNCIFNFATASVLTLGGAVNGTGSLTETGNGILAIGGAYGWNGDTTVSGGTLDLSSSASPTLTLGAGQTLKGNGTIIGSVNAGPGSTVAPGVSSIGRLTVSGAVTLNGTDLMKLNKSVSPSNDLLNVAGTLTYGGTLTVTNLAGSALAVGDSFKLFNAASYSGSFAVTNLPSSATWNWNPANGTLTVLTVVPTGPGIFTNPTSITGFSLNGTNIEISGTNGQSGDAYYLLQSTNLVVPLPQWHSVGTDVLSANGPYTITYTNVVVPGDPQRFYILSNTNYNP